MAVLEVDGLRKQYDDTVVVDDVSFDVAQGEIFGILGPNGAGKTTTVECLEGLRVPDAGHVRVLGLDPHRERAKLRQVLGVQLQKGMLPEKLRVREALALYRSFYRDGADIDRLLDDLRLTEKRNTAFEDLSGGQAQRLAIALALVGKPRIAILDELTTGLDPRAREDTWELIEQIRATGVTVLLVTHFMAEAQRLCDRIAILDRGKVVALDTPGGLIAAAGAQQRVRFRTSESFDTAVLERLGEVSEVRAERGEMVVFGTGDLLRVVSTELANHGIAATETRVEHATLDDAFLAFTGRAMDAHENV
ncbi:ABC-2 type transport system ATP-binding protein [Tamaricihabitans halophyticus]|uniref:ABC-2 type transport system ATP-binding protein n=1 Tax=Tamaricihabitans halophyticus TaxID=1262583 RepID=A0A4R2RCE9_9PSEU|nr:ABC transporter ATP-binding protein [Tamaricihabitans halophyticus]TCP57105.1 ABC-2 type transport system ATP-binding protein [Tamaricihabitans halophyticus]